MLDLYKMYFLPKFLLQLLEASNQGSILSKIHDILQEAARRLLMYSIQFGATVIEICDPTPLNEVL